MSALNADDIALRALLRMQREQFERPLIENNIRGVFVEYLVAELLGSGWRVSSTWDSWDLHGPRGERVEVKSSSYLQSWHSAAAVEAWRKPPSPSFDIRPRSGRWEGSNWVKEAGRAADIYIFAMHEELALSRADHRDLDQWAFYVARASDLPDQKRISLGPLRARFGRTGANELSARVAACFEETAYHG